MLFLQSLAQIVRTESLHSNLLRRLLHHGLDRPGAQALAVLRDGSQQSAILNPCSAHPGVDSLLHPEWNRYGTNAPSHAFEIGQHPTAFPELDGLDVEGGQLLRPRPADRER